MSFKRCTFEMFGSGRELKILVGICLSIVFEISGECGCEAL